MFVLPGHDAVCDMWASRSAPGDGSYFADALLRNPPSCALGARSLRQRPLFDHRPAEFGAPLGRVGGRFRADDIALVQIARRLVPVGFHPPGELTPGAA